MFETRVTQKIIIDLDITYHLIAKCNFIYNYYDNYSKYQTGLGKVLLFYRESTILLIFDNGFLKITNI